MSESFKKLNPKYILLSSLSHYMPSTKSQSLLNKTTQLNSSYRQKQPLPSQKIKQKEQTLPT